jgi:outer membrane immunogenic protein
MKHSLLAALAVAAAGLGVTGAAAQDFYVGAFAGGSDGDTDWTYQVGGNTADHSTDGTVFGLNAGWAKTFGTHFYAGIEGSYGWADIEGSTDCPNPIFSCASQIDTISSLRGIAGYAHNSWVFYGTGGFAWADATIETDDGGGPYGEDQGLSGYALGAGVQYKFGPNWSIRGEYIRYDFDDETFEVDSGELVDAELSTDVYSLGVNYHF